MRQHQADFPLPKTQHGRKVGSPEKAGDGKPPKSSHHIPSSGLKWREEQLTPQPAASTTVNHENKATLYTCSALCFSKFFPY